MNELSFTDIFTPAIRAEKEGIPQWLAAIREARDLEDRADALRSDAYALRCKGLDGECTFNAGHRPPCEIREERR